VYGLGESQIKYAVQKSTVLQPCKYMDLGLKMETRIVTKWYVLESKNMVSVDCLIWVPSFLQILRGVCSISCTCTKINEVGLVKTFGKKSGVSVT